MERLLKSILTIREIKFRMDDDYVDRLNRQYTVIILIRFRYPTWYSVPGTYQASTRDGLPVLIASHGRDRSTGLRSPLDIGEIAAKCSALG